jgi:hypothetical protein
MEGDSDEMSSATLPFSENESVTQQSPQGFWPELSRSNSISIRSGNGWTAKSTILVVLLSKHAGNGPLTPHHSAHIKS